MPDDQPAILDVAHEGTAGFAVEARDESRRWGVGAVDRLNGTAPRAR